jgi:aspartyl-tRNA(Asn)/glutamyl-tRNA(Gln) amidotransferase subunit A
MAAANDLCMMSLEDLAHLIAFKEVSPIEVTEAILDRIQRLDPRLNAFITVTGEHALAQAAAAEQEISRGEYRGLLHGVPIAVKDLFATKGVRTTAGSKILTDWVPDYDATVVTKLRDAGAISVGKLGLHEFAYGTTSDNAHFGSVHNPWRLDHVPGGSSGGSGAATAAGLAFATMGSDTGGSIRMPAAACGCVGLMPTFGRVSLHGAVPLSWTLDHAGPLTRTVRDAAIVLQAISGFDALDPTTEDVAIPDMLEDSERGPKGLRIGVPKQYFWENLDPEVERLTRKAVADLRAAGAIVVEIDYAPVFAYQQAFLPLMLADAAAYHAPNFPSRSADYSAQVGALLAAGAGVTGPQYAAATRVMQEARHGGADALLAGVDVLAVPTMPVPPPTIAASRAADPGARMASITGIFDLTGQPALSVPCGLTNAGLPASIMFVGRRWDEASVIWAGRAYETVRGPFPAPPIATA